MTNLELCQLSMMLLTDGYVSKNRYTYEIAFVNTSEVLLDKFEQLARNLFGVTRFGRGRKASGAWVSRFYSKQIAEQLLAQCGTFRTKAFTDDTFPEPQLPKTMDNLSDKELVEVLRLAFTLDGGLAIGIGKNRTEAKVLLKCFNPYLKRQLANLLNRLDVQHVANSEGLFIRKSAAILDFAERIGFLEGVRVGHDSKRFAGISKQRLLMTVSQAIKNNTLNEFGLAVRQAGAKTFQCISV